MQLLGWRFCQFKVERREKGEENEAMNSRKVEKLLTGLARDKENFSQSLLLLL